jgi:hypothetical protein
LVAVGPLLIGMWRSLSLPSVEKAYLTKGPGPIPCRGPCLDRRAGPASAVGRIDRLRLQLLASVLVTAGWGDGGEWPLAVDGFRSHPVDGAIDGRPSDAEEFGQLGLGVVA